MSDNKKKGIFFIILAALGFSVMNTLIKMTGDLPSYEKSFFRNFVSFFVALWLLRHSGKGFSIQKGCLGFLFLRASFGTIGILCNYYAVDHMLLADASLLNKTSPFFAILFSVLIMKEAIRPGHIAILAAVTGGCVLVLHPSFADTNLFAGLVALAGGAAAGAAYSIVRKLSSLHERSEVIVVFFSAFSCLVTLPALIIGYKPMTAVQFVTLLAAGCAAAVGQLSITKAYSCAPAREISVFSYTQIIFSALWGFLFFDQLPDLLSWAGYVIIISMAVLMMFYNRSLAEKGTQPAA